MKGDTLRQTPERLEPGTEAWKMYIVEHRQRYQLAANHVAGKCVLDVACGVGYGTEMLADNGASNVVGLDISRSALEFAQRDFSHYSAIFGQSDAVKLPLPADKFDLVVSFETLEHLPEPEALLCEVRRVLKPCGLFISSIPNPDYLYRGRKFENVYHQSELPLDVFEGIYQRYFAIQERYFQARSEGFKRHEDFVEAVHCVNEAVRFSRLFRMENFIRNILGRRSLTLSPLSNLLWRAVEGDYEIHPLEDATTSDQMVFIHLGQPV